MELEYVKFSLKTMKPDAFHVKLHFLSKRAIYNPIPLPVAPAGTGEADRVSRENKANAETDQERNNFVKRMNKRPMPKWIRIKLLEQPANATLNDALRISADHFLFFNNMRSADDITSDGLIEVQADVTEYLVSALSEINRTQKQMQEHMSEMTKGFFYQGKERDQKQQRSGSRNENQNFRPRQPKKGNLRPGGPQPQLF